MDKVKNIQPIFKKKIIIIKNTDDVQIIILKLHIKHSGGGSGFQGFLFIVTDQQFLKQYAVWYKGVILEDL